MQKGAATREARTLLKLAAPVILSQFLMNSLALISTAVTGRLGTAELAAVAYANATYYLGFMLLVGVMLAVSPRIAAAHGAHNPAGVARSLMGGLALAALLSSVFLPLAFFASHLIELHAPGSAHPTLAAPYLRIYALGMPATLGAMALRGALEGTGHPRRVTAVMLGGALFLLLLSPAFAFGWGPLPALGVQGVAWAMTAVYWLVFLALAFITRRYTPFVINDMGELRAEVMRLLKLGWPIGLTMGAEGGLFTLSSLLMARFGQEALAAHSLALQVITAVFMVPLGLSTAAGIRVAQQYGAGNLPGARRSGLLGGAMAIGIMLLVSVVYVTVPRFVLSAFVDVNAAENAVLVANATAFLLIATLFQMFDGLQVTANSVLRGLQDTRVPMLISLASYWLVGLGSGYLLAFVLHVGPRGLWYGLTASLICAAVLLSTRFLGLTAQARRWT